MTFPLDRLSNAASAGRTVPQAAASSNWMREFLSLIGLLVWAWAVLALLSYSLHDSAFSTTGAAWADASHPASYRNWMGRLGAWFADLTYLSLGFSAWTLLGALAMRRLRQLRTWHWWLGSLLLLLSSCTLEWSRLSGLEPYLPGSSGGALGYVLGMQAQHGLGFTGSALLCCVVWVLGLAGAAGLRWGNSAEYIGHSIEQWIQRRRAQRELRQDAALGERAALARVRAEAEQKEAAALSGAAAFTASAPPPMDSTTDADLPQSQSSSPSPSPSPESLLSLPAGQETAPALQWLAEAQINSAMVAGLKADESSAASLSLPLPLMDEVPSLPPTPLNAAALIPAIAVPAPAKVLNITPQQLDAVVPSERAAKERQHGLFSELGTSNLPQIALLDEAQVQQETVSMDTLEMTSRLIEKKLKDFGVQVQVVAAMPGPVITRYEIEPATGVKGSQIVGLAKDLARSLSLVSIRVIETIPGKNYMALELPNMRRQSIRLSEILGSQVYNDAKSMLTMGLGKDIVGKPVVADLAKMPHVLVAGTTGSGKSVGINAMILSLLYKAEATDVRVLMIDPKMLEMSVYEGIPHLLAPVVTDMKQAAHGLNWCVAEMEKRYKLMSKMGVRNLAGYNTKLQDAAAKGQSIANPFSLNPEEPEPLERLPHIVVVIDELADLMMVVGKKIEELIARLAQKARAAGIHLILATQRPSVDVITGLIKANIPTRIAFQVSSKIDSRTILDQMGAEALLGMGDMLYMPSGTGLPIRVHGAFVSDEEVHRVVAYLKERGGEPNYIEGVLEGGTGEDGDLLGGDVAGASGEQDPLYDQAVAIVLQDRKPSISYVQRKLKIGYNRAARLLEDMEKAGLVGSLSSNGQREILVAKRPD
jgi:DNA segregation ATPase FtsK/SpoIIIE, S-DNA-T family